jgi:hypothetical protein
MISMNCQICNDTGAVITPVKIIERMIWRDGEKVFIQDKSGGIDACPDCAALANAQWHAATIE